MQFVDYIELDLGRSVSDQLHDIEEWCGEKFRDIVSVVFTQSAWHRYKTQNPDNRIYMVQDPIAYQDPFRPIIPDTPRPTVVEDTGSLNFGKAIVVVDRDIGRIREVRETGDLFRIPTRDNDPNNEAYDFGPAKSLKIGDQE